MKLIETLKSLAGLNTVISGAKLPSEIGVEVKKHLKSARPISKDLDLSSIPGWLSIDLSEAFECCPKTEGYQRLQKAMEDFLDQMTPQPILGTNILVTKDAQNVPRWLVSGEGSEIVIESQRSYPAGTNRFSLGGIYQHYNDDTPYPEDVAEWLWSVAEANSGERLPLPSLPGFVKALHSAHYEVVKRVRGFSGLATEDLGVFLAGMPTTFNALKSAPLSDIAVRAQIREINEYTSYPFRVAGSNCAATTELLRHMNAKMADILREHLQLHDLSSALRAMREDTKLAEVNFQLEAIQSGEQRRGVMLEKVTKELDTLSLFKAVGARIPQHAYGTAAWSGTRGEQRNSAAHRAVLEEIRNRYEGQVPLEVVSLAGQIDGLLRLRKIAVSQADLSTHLSFLAVECDFKGLLALSQKRVVQEVLAVMIGNSQEGSPGAKLQDLADLSAEDFKRLSSAVDVLGECKHSVAALSRMIEARDFTLPSFIEVISVAAPHRQARVLGCMAETAFFLDEKGHDPLLLSREIERDIPDRLVWDLCHDVNWFIARGGEAEDALAMIKAQIDLYARVDGALKPATNTGDREALAVMLCHYFKTADRKPDLLDLIIQGCNASADGQAISFAENAKRILRLAPPDPAAEIRKLAAAMAAPVHERDDVAPVSGGFSPAPV